MKKLINFNESKSQISKKLSTMHAMDIAKLLYELDAEKRIKLIEIIPIELVDDVFLQLEEEELLDFFFQLDNVRQRRILKELSAANLKSLFEQFNDVDKSTYLKQLTNDKKEELDKILHYDEASVQSIMHDNYLTLNKELTIGDAMKQIVSNVLDNDLIDTIFILDNDRKLYGVVYLKDLIIARKTDYLIDIVNTDVKVIQEDSNINEAIKKISNYDIQVLPVVSLDNELLGIISADDVLEEIALEHESNIDKFVAVGDFDEYSSPFKRAYQRLPWLLVSIVLNLVIALFLSIFSTTIETVTALILFQPLILGMAGNIGTQAIAVTILKIHKNEAVNLKDHIIREIKIGLINAIIIGILGFLLSLVYLSVTSFNMASVDGMIYLLSLVIGLSLFLSMFLSAMFGVFIPIVLTKFKVDPAAASGPVISTINDLVALLIYFGLATLIIIPLIA